MVPPWPHTRLSSSISLVSTVPVPIMPRLASSGATPVSSGTTFVLSVTHLTAVVIGLRENNSVR